MLLLRPDHLGDVLLTAPAIALLRASLPRAELTYLVGPWSVEAARYGPPVDRLATLDFPGFTRRANANLLAPYVLLARTAPRLRRRRYDLAIVLRPDHWWGALLAQAAGIPCRIGVRTPETAPLLTHARAPAPAEHAAEQASQLARFALDVVGCPAIPVGPTPLFRLPPAARATALSLLGGHGLADTPRLVALQPLAGAALKSWPLERWASLADRLAETGASVLLMGGPAEAPLLEDVRHRARSRPAVQAGQSLAVSAAIYERCRVLVAPDSGAAHLAAAVGTPTVRLYGPASVAAYGPWPARDDQQVLFARSLACVPCGALEQPPCGARTLPACMLALGTDDVAQTVNHLSNRG